MTRSLLDLSIKMQILVSEERPYISHHPGNILRATDVAFKSYKRQCSESSENFRYIFACNFQNQHKSTFLGPKLLQG